MKFSVVAFVLAVLACESAWAQVVSLGQCTDHPVVQDFDVGAYLGKWYELSRYEQRNERNGECVTETYTLNLDGSIRMENRMLVAPIGHFVTQIGRAMLSFPEEIPLQAMLNVSFFGIPPDRSNYWVLDTDYVSFAFVWNCYAVNNNLRAESFWLLSREPQLDQSVEERVEELFDLYLVRRHIRTTRHDLLQCMETEIPSTTVDPEMTTSDTDMTTSDPEESTTDLESTISDPEETTIDPETTISDLEVTDDPSETTSEELTEESHF